MQFKLRVLQVRTSQVKDFLQITAIVMNGFSANFQSLKIYSDHTEKYPKPSQNFGEHRSMKQMQGLGVDALNLDKASAPRNSCSRAFSPRVKRANQQDSCELAASRNSRPTFGHHN